MSKLVDGIARVTSGIVEDRRSRSEMARAIKSLTENRHNEVHSLLDAFGASRRRSTEAQALELKDVTSARHDRVVSMLDVIESSRVKEAAETTRQRMQEMKSFLDAGRQHLREISTTRRQKATALMRDLTDDVTRLLDEFDKNNRERAIIVRTQLSSYAADRHAAEAVWSGGHSQATVRAHAAHRS